MGLFDNTSTLQKKKGGGEKKDEGREERSKGENREREERREGGKLGTVMNKDLLRTQRQKAREILEGTETRGP